ncbi:hypothetical protein VNO78_23837 [Psophocarpus tetragonolobus]|uniref:Uncharacterized protein n=1 Tax=Psophocarpus tetragonolobus TaxID=3891 RepID=A0AAN9S5I1_PSOTE
MFSDSDMASCFATWFSSSCFATWFSSCLKGKRFESLCLPFRSTLKYLTSQCPKKGEGYRLFDLLLFFRRVSHRKRNKILSILRGLYSLQKNLHLTERARDPPTKLINRHCLPFMLHNNLLRRQGLVKKIMDRIKSKSEMSLCEKSMKVVVNVIRLSSFSIAQMTLGATSTRKASPGSDVDPDEESLVPDQFPASKRSQQPQSRANPIYVIKSDGSNGSTEHLIYQERVPGDVNPKKEQCVDKSASDYICKIRNKLARGV